ncbi:glycosyltransferase family 24 protein [Hypholoma sublateritium FD-334 SS-4]|uniref:Glycosyltransferase family 24 protein n=1 Tax=Hypholoma sublateritium (strain FD-334 SS-4) TaxID=945553 RepID=A0A0D2Q220_HYPSF|nr:glycosyltransferase family 24 protein [Hypholoma sublateritium FD-334 SS-4]
MKSALRLLVAAFSALQVAGSSSPPVKVELRSSWPAPPFLSEILETVSLENPDEFFTYVDLLTGPDGLVSSNTLSPEAILQTALEIGIDNGIIRDISVLNTIQMNLAMHAATPKLEAFYSYYDGTQGELGAESKYDKGKACGSWVDWYGKVVCDVETLAHLAGVEAIDPPKVSNTDAPQARPKLLTFDHIFPPPAAILERPPRTAILYASLTSSNFRELHTYLMKLTNRLDPHVEYVFRHVPPAAPSEARNFLSGYGVALDLKKMDYLALDDRNTNTEGGSRSTSKSDSEQEEEPVDPVLSLIFSHPENTSAPDASVPLTAEEFANLGAQTAQIITSSSSPLNTLTQLSQNFPKYMTTVARRVVVNESLEDGLHENSLRVQQGLNAMWLNGLQVEPKVVHPFGLLKLLKKEKGVIENLVAQGLDSTQAFEVLTHSAISEAQRGGAAMDAVFDASDRPEGGDVIVWWNDMEKDKRYARWSPSLLALLRPMYPGALPNIKANLFNVILVVDLSKISTLNFLAGAVSSIINRDIPLRFGMVPVSDSDDGRKMAKLFYHLITNHGRRKTLEFLSALAQLQLPPHMRTETVQWEAVRTIYDRLHQSEGEEKPEELIPTLASIFDDQPEETVPFEKIGLYADRLGATLSKSAGGHAFFNGKHFDFNDDLLRNLQAEVAVQIAFLQEKVYTGALADGNYGETMANWFYDLPTTNLRRNSYIYPSSTGGNLRIFNLPDVFGKTRFRASPATYLYSSAEFEAISESLYIVADLDSEAGRSLIKEAITSLTAESKTRIAFIHNPISPNASEKDIRPPTSWMLAHLHIRQLLSKATPASLLSALDLDGPVVPSESTQIPIGQRDAFKSLSGGISLSGILPEEYVEYVKTSRLVARTIQLVPGEAALVVNGRVVGPIAPDDFQKPDFAALEEYESRKRAEPVVKALSAVAPQLIEDKYLHADIVSMVASVVASTHQPDPSESGLFDAPPQPRQTSYKLLESNYTKFEFGDNATAIHHIAVVLDPLSETGQKWSGLITWLSSLPDIHVEIHLNPGRYNDVPLKRFYRYNLLQALSFDSNGQIVHPQTVFEDMPIDPIYTLAMDVPTAWLVRPSEALYDLDNIQLGKLFPGDNVVEAIFQLDYIVIEGHARESSTQTPPRGLQVQLVTGDGAQIDDTQVVANLGYFQFKATPGVFQLEIRPGRGRAVFKLDSAGNEGWESPTVEEAGNEITVTSFEGLTLYPRFSRLPGQEIADVLAEAEEEGSKGLFDDLSNKVFSMFKGKEDVVSTDVVTVKQQADINIFTVASGLLYERFVGIMILSVLRNTNSTVKFWFIENFLSPSFLEFIPHMAKEYNFDYELVTYKWPSWLRAQTEKQRIIWAYKILFLDVLFPMDLKKVIFVDADQIVRADLKELVDLDLQGAPYGYTPMGDDNTDMEGFRFWKTGYWREFLRGKSYHISALYVIDLVRFRQLAAGDILRGQYQQLSADPNSLANLDQDLPNNIQDQVPIFSLDEDWLWCETWCSKDRLHRAKTIDLCQNPLTKEPKLARARQIPEWDEYDTEIAQLTRRLAEEGKIHSRMATADANVLADAGAATAGSVKPPADVDPEHDPLGVAEGDAAASEGPSHDEL